MVKEVQELTSEQKTELHGMLLKKREELTTKLKIRRADAGAEKSRSGDEADQATEDAGVAMETRLMDREAKLLREVERALKKIDSGDYGFCEGTDEPIGYARLCRQPWTRHSVIYKEEMERAQKHK